MQLQHVISDSWQRGVDRNFRDPYALFLDLLLSVSFNITSEEVESGLVGLDGVAEVVLGDWLALPQEGADCLDARGALKILSINQLLDVLVHLH